MAAIHLPEIRRMFDARVVGKGIGGERRRRLRSIGFTKRQSPETTTAGV
jgi:hypothetical protein